MKKLAVLAVVFVGAVIGGILSAPATSLAACALKVWNQGDTLKVSDLNSNYSCLNTRQMTNADIASGAISRAQMQIPALQIVAWADVQTTCGTGLCTLNASAGIASVTQTGSNGVYSVVLLTSRPDTTYTVISVPANATQAGGAGCTPSALTNSSFTLSCKTNGVPQNDAPKFIVLDDE